MGADTLRLPEDQAGGPARGPAPAAATRGPLLLSLPDCSLSTGLSVGRLRRTSAAILAVLAARHPHAVGARDLAEWLAIRTGVDPISGARAAVTILRAELRVLGLAAFVRSRRGVGYWLDAGHDLRVLGVLPPEEEAAPRGNGPRSLPSLLDAIDALADPSAERVGSTVMLPFGILDIGDRCLSLAGRRISLDSERDFNLLAATALACGRPVDEALLLRFCGMSPGPSGAEILRRAVRQLNQTLGERGVALRIEPLRKPYGSPYCLSRLARHDQAEPRSSRDEIGVSLVPIGTSAGGGRS